MPVMSAWGLSRGGKGRSLGWQCWALAIGFPASVTLPVWVMWWIS